MHQNFIFTGFGHAAGKYKITNSDLEFATKSNYLKGFREDKLLISKNYLKLKEKNPELTPFSYFAEYKMGFKTRHHVSPFPPGAKQQIKFETSLDLAVKAVGAALEDAGIHPENIDAWFFSTVSPHEQAPGIAATIKCFFTKPDNYSPTMTLASGCSGFLLNLERAVDYLKCNPDVNNIIVGHTETMSSFLWNLTHYVPFVTFGDAAAAVVVSRKENKTREGIIEIKNLHDMKMIDFVGVDKEWNLYMHDAVIKERAVENITKIGAEILRKSLWNADETDMIVPHQTGNAILHESAEKLNIPVTKLYQDVQLNYGNVSGTSIPMSLSLLNKENQLKTGNKILSVTAGVGGIFGAFTYIVPEKISENKISLNSKDLQGKKAIVTGSTGGLGKDVAIALAKRGCSLILQYNSNDSKAKELEKELQAYKVSINIIKADFSDPQQVEELIQQCLALPEQIDYLIHTAAISGGLARATDISDSHLKKVEQVNHFAPVEITKRLKNKIKSVILYTGSVAEDGQFSGSSPYVESKKGLHGFAASFAYEAMSAGLRSIYFMPGIVSGGMADELDEKAIAAVKMSILQDENVSTDEIADRMARSLYLLKVLNVRDSYEGALLVRRDSYLL